MILLLLIITILIILIVIISLAWRWGSRRHTLPCPVWMKWLLDPPFPGGVSPRTGKTIERLDIHPGMNVLDAGCGPGRLSIPIAKITGPGGTVTAMDIQDGMLQEVRRRADKETITNIRFIQGGIGEGTLENAHYDRAVLITVLGEIPDREVALREIFGAMKPGGMLLIEETIRDPHFQTRSTVLEIAGLVGFVEKEFFGNRFSYTLILEKPSSSR
ncbi:MAG: methyltransferase domain-containing protein [Methanobacteriota archaeon]